MNTPLAGSIAAPSGAPNSENVSVCGGRSGSVAVAVNVKATSSGVVRPAGTSAETVYTFAAACVPKKPN